MLFRSVFRCTEGLQKKYGKSRVFDAPISEGGIVGAAVGMGAYGLRPVAEIQFADYIYPAYDQIVSEAARLRHRSAGDFTAPLTIRVLQVPQEPPRQPRRQQRPARERRGRDPPALGAGRARRRRHLMWEAIVDPAYCTGRSVSLRKLHVAE